MEKWNKSALNGIVSAKGPSTRQKEFALKNLTQRLAAATALALLTAGIPTLASAERRTNDTEGSTVQLPTLQLAQADTSSQEPTAEEQEELKRRQAEEAAAAKAAEEAAAAKAAEEAAAAKAAEEAAAAKAAEEAAAAKAAEEAAAAKAAEEAAAAKAAEEAAAAKAAEEAAAAKAAEEAAAAKAAEEAAAAKAAEDEAAKKAAEQQPAQATEQPAAEQPAQSAEQPATTEQPAATQQPAQAAEQPAATEQPAANSAEDDAAREQRRRERQEAREKRRQERQQEQASDPSKAATETAPPEGEAPVLDSQKEPEAAPADGGTQTAQPAPAPAEPAAPPPTSDAEAQAETVKAQDIAPVAAEEGRRVEGERAPRRERREGVDVMREINGRIIIDLGGRPVVESSDRPRMERNAREVYYEELSRGRTRETIVRRNGVQIVTIRDRYGEVLRRSRIMPDGREYVLVYVDEDRRGRGDDGRWRDPGLDLPPMVLTIPYDEYILTDEDASDVDDYYDFLDQPPVERVQRLYSVDEVKRSARVRDTVRRVDLDTVTFEFGSAEIKEDAIARLDNVAKAMERMLKDNPAETFLIEGHTDAVGSDMANLALSDRRAEAVAAALTDVFEIPPENLTTQGYGEQYLKVRTDGPEERNRRVAIRRITPLVSPVASAQ